MDPRGLVNQGQTLRMIARLLRDGKIKVATTVELVNNKELTTHDEYLTARISIQVIAMMDET